MNFETLSKISAEELRDDTKRELAKCNKWMERAIEKLKEDVKSSNLNVPSITIIIK